ncbi:MAG TPA: oligosaccharide flippase family protein [Chitinophagaceae bacterium]|nr:oligosaccharide flippase family protein [Chitinophagaceae bacterium]
MSSIRKLAGQTIWYGLSSIFGRFLNYLLTPILATIFASAEYGKITTLFTIAAFLNIIYTYGLETSYFRFSSLQAEPKVYNTSSSSIIVTTLVFTGVLWIFTNDIAAFLEMPGHPEYILWVILIVALDTLCVMPFAKLRYTGRPRKFAFIKILNIIINVGLVIFFLIVCKNDYEKNAKSFFASLYDPKIGLGYVIIANLIASGVTLLLLAKEFFQFKFKPDAGFWKEMMRYSWPLIIVGFGGMINETIDRIMLLKFYPGTTEQAFSQSGIYSANYKLAVLIVLFIQAFRMGAEPFFFKQSTSENAQRVYARVMKFFVIACCFCFLAVVLFLDIWKYFMGTRHPEYYTGLKVVPVLMVAKIFLGVYYNLSVWYKLTNRNLTGAWITLGGALITILFNWIFIPIWGYMACAIATVLCYGFMMVTSYFLGQKHYRIPYAWKKLLTYIIVCIILFGVHQAFLLLGLNPWINRVAGLVLIGLFSLLILNVEKKEFQRLPYIGKYFSPKPA